jgi:tetratricopeptide (TPR) repeat protein
VFKLTSQKQQLFLLGIMVVLLLTISWFGFNSSKAVYDKPVAVETQKPVDVNIFDVLHRFAGSSSELNTLITNIEKDSLNDDYLQSLKSIGENSKIDVFLAYANYMEGIKQKNQDLLMLSANLFFEAGTHDPDSLADKTVYAVYGSRACDRILENDPNNLKALTRKATFTIYFGGDIMNNGVVLLKKVESIDSNYVDAQHYLMLLAIQSGQVEKAKKRLKKLLHLQPDNQQYVELLKELETQ